MSIRLQVTWLVWLSLLLCAQASPAQTTLWQGDPATPGDWFDPANWTAGVPTNLSKARIANSGTALISSGDAQGDDLNIAYDAAGYLEQNGGSLTIASDLWVGGGVAGASGSYTLNDGQVTAIVGGVGSWAGDGTFHQYGGNANFSQILFVGGGNMNPPAPSWFPLRGTATATYVQEGGQTTARRFFVGDDPFDGSPGQASYQLANGRLQGEFETLIPSGRLTQTGGTNATSYMNIEGGRYEYFGGSLEVGGVSGGGGLHLVSGELDFGGGLVALSFPSGILNLSGGSMFNTAHVDVSGGDNALLIFPAGFDPATQFHSYVNTGLTAFAGSDVIVPAGRSIEGTGILTDFFDVYGTVIGNYAYGNWGGISVHGGIYVHSGSHVNLGTGELYITDTRSGMSGGYLQANGYLHIGTSGGAESGIFRQSDGRNVAERIYVYSGQYIMTGGSAEPWYLNVGDRYAPGEFQQQAGSVNVGGALGGGLEIERGRYTMAGGSLWASNVTVGSADHNDTATLEIANGTSVTLGPVGIRSNGILRAGGSITGNVSNAGNVDVAGAEVGTLALTGSYSQTSTGRLNMGIGGTASTAYDQLNVTGGMSLAGTLNLVLVDGFMPLAGSAFDILDFSSLSGTFTQMNLPSLAYGRWWEVSELYTNGILRVFGQMHGDLNGDGITDSLDIHPFVEILVTGTYQLEADMNDDGAVNALDIKGFVDCLTVGACGGGSAAGIVPEPATLALLAFGTLALRRRGDADAG